jgi:HSP20 family protein
MMLERWDPFGEIMSLRQAMDRLFEEAWIRPTRLWAEEGMYTPIDLSETEDEFIVKMALPGIKPDEVEINVTGNTLTVRGEHKEDKEAQQARTWHRREIRYGRFERSIALPTEVQADRAEATFENGMLTLRLPKAEAAKPKRIPISTPQRTLPGQAT